MRSAFIIITVLFLAIPFSWGQELFFKEQPGVLEFSGHMLARPLQAEREAAAARLDAWRIGYEEALDMHILKIPAGFDENTFAALLMETGDYEYVEPDWICYPIATPNDPMYNQQWHHPKMDSPEAWDLFTGDPGFIASFVDTGVDKDHEDLASHLLPGYNAVDRLTEAQGGDVNDINGHGTAVSGCIGAIGNNGKGVAGMNWSISLIPVRASNSSGGSANMSDLTHGAIWAAQNGAKTISVSYSGVSSSAVGSAGTTVRNLDALLIWAAGNDSSNLSGFDWLDVIVAGATDQNDDKASFSNYGEAIDVMAPGVSIMTTQNGGGYNGVGGTSFSAPLTNGTCALIWSYNPAQTADDVEQALFDGCDDLGNPGLYGHGRINAFEAAKLALPALILSLPQGVPSGVQPPGLSSTVTVKIQAGFENYAAGSGRLHYRFDSGSAYTEVPVTPVGGDLYEVVIPNTVPGDEPEFYFSAQGSGGTTVTSPSSAPASVYAFDVYFVETLMEDDFESDMGWTVQSTNLDTGEWERADPQSTDAQPGDDHSAVGTKCWVTGPLAGSGIGTYDVDGGPTRLLSPVIDLSSGDAQISFYTYFHHSSSGTVQPLDIHVTANGTTWVKVESMNNSPSWTLKSFQVSNHVTPSDKVQVRISATDNPNDSIVEALVDDFSVARLITDASLWADGYTIPVSTGTVIDFSLDAGAGNAGRPYLLLGSLSGTEPGLALPGGEVLPLNWDAFTDLIFLLLGTPIFQDFMGNLDGSGTASATLDTMGSLNPALIGVTAHFAYTLGSPFDFTSNAMPVTFDP